jgi:hypothetical protein
MFTFHIPVVIFARYPFRVDDSSVISDRPVEETRQFKMMTEEGISVSRETVSDASLRRNVHEADPTAVAAREVIDPA